LPIKLRKHYLHICHDDSGHYGVDRCIHHLRYLWWPLKSQDIVNYVASCTTCQKRKGDYMQKSKTAAGHLQHGDRPFQCITIDFVHMERSLRGKAYILTIMDNFTRFLYVVPTTRDRAVDACEGLVKFILEYGIPESIGSDRGVHFINALFAELCDKLQIAHNIHCAYRPQSSGNLERAHRTLKNSIWIMCEDNAMDWEQALPYCRRAFNLAFNAATKCSPHFAIFGREPDLTGLTPPSGEKVCKTPQTYGLKIKELMLKAHAAIKRSQEIADLKLEKQLQPAFQSENIQPGDEVLLKREQSVEAKRSHLPWIGPFKVISSNRHILRIENTIGKRDFVHRQHVVKVIQRKPDLSDDLVPDFGVDVQSRNDVTRKRDFVHRQHVVKVIQRKPDLSDDLVPDFGVDVQSRNDVTTTVKPANNISSVEPSDSQLSLPLVPSDSEEQFMTPEPSPVQRKSLRKKFVPERLNYDKAGQIS